ncbi:MAG TPA: hypothetical protein VGD99_21160 [Anaerolineae bacterium]|jgi:hypothetical protein
MSLYISIIGIDGSGKSLVTLALADLAAAELGLTTAAISDEVWVKTSDEDLLRPDFAPAGLAARLDRLFRRFVKAATHIHWLYPTLKIIQLLMHKAAARQIKTRYQPEVIFGDGNLLLTSGGWASNYMSPPRPASGDTITSVPITPIKTLYNYIEPGESLSPGIDRPIPGLKLMRHLLAPNGVLLTYNGFDLSGITWETGQHAENLTAMLSDSLDDFNIYITASFGGTIAGFISITPPNHRSYFCAMSPAWDLSWGSTRCGSP